MLHDVDLLEKIVQKDKEAFETIYRAYFSKLYTLSFRYVKDGAIAEELANDVFVMLWLSAEKLCINQSLNLYLSRSIINLSLTYLKRNQRFLNENSAYLKYVQFTADGDETDLAARYESKLLLIESMLESLPPQCRKIVLMSKYEKMKQREIAAQLGISIKTVKNQMTIAYDKIRITLTKQKTYCNQD